MNPYFLLIYMASFFVEGWSMASLLGYALGFFKYVRIFISMMTPEPKGTVEVKRGFLKVAYYSDDGDGLKKKYVLLPIGGKEKTWTKAEAVLRITYKEFLETELVFPSPSQEFLNTPAVSVSTPDPPGEETVVTETIEDTAVVDPPPTLSSVMADDDLLQDIDDIATGKDVPSQVVRKRTVKKATTTAQKYKNCPKEDVTAEMLSLAGFNKDFFGVQLTPKDISSAYQALIFHYGKRQKTFDTDDVIAFF